MEAKRTNWNDDRLDELSRRVDDGFKQMGEGFARVDAKFDRMNSRIDRLFYIQIAFMASLAIGVLTGQI